MRGRSPERRHALRRGIGARLGRFALSPINRRRWANFKANRRGYWSFSIFSSLFVAVAVRRVHRQRPAHHRALQGRDCCFRCSSIIRNRSSAAFSRSPTTRTRSSSTRSTPTAGCCGRRSAISYDTINKDYPRRKGQDGRLPRLSRRRRRGHRAPRSATRRPTRSRASRARQYELARPRRSGPRRASRA